MYITVRITALFLIILLSPLLLLIAFCSLILQGRPIIFTQQRVGKNFEHFKIYKFRSLAKNAKQGAEFIENRELGLTKWGQFLRKTKLDELPQLLNIVKGEMLFIGPRPEIPEFVDKNSFGYLKSIKPGLSGYSSIIFRDESSIWSMLESKDPYSQILKIKVSLDNYYLIRKSFFEDMKLVAITLMSILMPKTMGHYLIIKLLSIEDDNGSKLREAISKLKIKKLPNKDYPFSKNKNKRILILSDIISIMCGFLFASLVRNDFVTPDLLHDDTLYNILCILLVTKLLSFSFFGMFRGMWRYTSLVDMLNIFKANVFGTILVIALIGYFRGFQGIPRSIFMIDFILTFGFTSLSRISIRIIYSHLLNPKRHAIQLNKRVMIIGAGSSGEFICKEILNDSRYQMEPVGFLDDNVNMHGKFIHGREVLGNISSLSEHISNYDEALICCPSTPRTEIFKIIEICKNSGKPFKTLPSVDQMFSGKLSVNQLQEVSVIDLLGRREVKIDDSIIKKYIGGKRILITGAGGSIGSELVRQCLRYEPALMVMLDNSEYNLFQIEREIMSDSNNVLTKPLLSNIRDSDVLKKIFSQYQPQVIFHAAAYKHVSMQEAFPWEAINTNVIGTANLVKLSLEHDVKKFVLVSTDKAVKPINVMGATKRLAELICQGANTSYSTRFMSVRFGNVLGSSGSVIPIFQEQIKAGGPITITDPEMERYFMSITEAAQLIIQAGSLGKGGEVYALDMGQPIKIIDIANELIRLSGLEPEIDIPISFIGARPGEKQYEDLIHDKETSQKTFHEKIYEIQPNLTIDEMRIISERIMAGELNGMEFDSYQLRKALCSLVPDYKPLAKDRTEPILLKVKPEIEA